MTHADSGAASETSSHPWRVGTATATITPGDESLPLAGFAARDGPMEGIDQDVHAKAVAIEDATGTRQVMVSVEILSVRPSLRRWLAERCAEEFDLPPESLLLTVTHTHYAPAYGVREDELVEDANNESLEDADEESRRIAAYRAELETALLDVVERALSDLEPAELSHTRGRCSIAMSRRRPTEDGIAFSPYPDGPTNHEVPVLAAETDDGLKAIVFGYACHPTSVNVHNRVTGDWPGYAMEFLESDHPDATAVFLIGCAGDQKAYPQGSLTLTKQHGRTMANAVNAVLDAPRKPVGGPLERCLEATTLSFTSPDAEGNGGDKTVATKPYPVQAVGFGSDLTLVALAGEAVVGYSHLVADELSGDVWVSAYANDGFGYVPTVRVLHEGGYEANRAWGNPGDFDPSVEERVVEHACALAQRVGARRE